MYDELKKYTQEVKSFHMPGHKNGKLALMNDLYQLDVTEVPGTDDLHHPTGIIKDVQKQIAHIYQSHQSYLLTNGSTSGILATIATIARQEGSVLVARNCHKAVYNGLCINGLNVHYLYPKYDSTYGYYKAISPSDLEDMLIRYPDIHTVILTSPTYEGIVSDIGTISPMVHQYGASLVVDEAHGAHFIFGKALPKSAIELGADYVIQSTHKTLPCLTQTAVLHIHQCDKEIQTALEENLAIFQSSSPSYILMSSIEKGIEYMHTHRIEFDHWIQELIYTLEKYPIDGGRWLNNKEHDLTRLSFLIEDEAISGYALSEKLRKDHHIQVEMAQDRYIVAITTMADSMQDIKHLIESIRQCLLDLQVEKKDVRKKENNPIPQERPDQYMSMNEAKSWPNYSQIDYKKAVNRIAREMIIPYPPGIPLVLPGERFTQEIIDYLESLDKQGKEIYGIIEGEISFLVL